MSVAYMQDIERNENTIEKVETLIERCQFAQTQNAPLKILHQIAVLASQR